MTTAMAKKIKRPRTEWVDNERPDHDDELDLDWPVKVDPDEREEYEDWRSERRARGRKPRGKAGDRHQRGRQRDDDL
jgi:hypothetical protein